MDLTAVVKLIRSPFCWLGLFSGLTALTALVAAENDPGIPRFSVEHMDRSVEPSADFYRFAAGNWLKRNPVPSDKASWGAFMQLRERNWFLIHEILEESLGSKSSKENSVNRQVGVFYASAMNTNLIEKLRFKPIEADLKRIERAGSVKDLFKLAEDFHERDIHGMFGFSAPPDAKNSTVYAVRLSQGGLSMPDRDYYLKPDFAKQREAFLKHVTRMFELLGEPNADAAKHASLVMEMEKGLAEASRTRTELRDPNANYNKTNRADFVRTHPAGGWDVYFAAADLSKVPQVIVGQPEFFQALDQAVKSRPLADWKVYWRWHLLRAAAPYLHREVELESFNFQQKELSGQPEQEPRWQRAAHMIDGSIGEALGELYVRKHFTPVARARMEELVGNLRAVFTDRLRNCSWMSDETRQKGLAKFERFTQKIGHPTAFRDYSKIKLKEDDLLGNLERSARFDSKRQLARVGRPVDKAEWHMTPPTVNAYFNPSQNEIVFPAGILQPPFFDVEADDAVNYGAIGVVIGHEITHGYDDKGRQFDAEGNLNDWWTEKDAKEFEARAQKVVDQYNAYEPLPGVKVNGKLTLGENIADLGGTSIAYEALQRALAKDPSKRKVIDGFTPEQRFFLSLAQLWRTNAREAFLKRQVTVDPHSPGQFRATGPHVNTPEFFEAFQIKPGSPMWRAPEQRAKIW